MSSQPEFILYTHPHSRGAVALWMLEECGASYETVVLNYDSSMKTPEYLRINPMGKVPALVHGNIVITETSAICAYLADQFPDQQLTPKHDNAALANYYRWLFFSAGPLNSLMDAVGSQSLPKPEFSSMVGYGNIESIEAMVDLAMTQASPYLCGTQFTAADLYFAGYLAWAAQEMKFLKLTPEREAYLNRTLQRDAKLRSLKIAETLSKELTA